MKKWYKIIILLSIISGILAKAKNVFAEETVDRTAWINWASSHNNASASNPVVGYGESSGHITPHYCFYLEDSSPGIVIKYDASPSDNVGPQYWYISKVNTAYLASENRATETVTQRSLGTTGVIIDSDFYTNFPELNGTTLYRYGYQVPKTAQDSIVLENYDISCTSTLDLKNQLEQLNYQPPVDQLGNGDLPLLSFSLEKKIVPQLSLNVTTMKEIFKWDYTEKDPYKTNPQNYTFDIMASANWTTSGTGVGEIWDSNNLSVNNNARVTITNGNDNISVNEYSFLYANVGQKLYSMVNKSFTDDSINSASLGYILYIRTREVRGNRASVWKIFKVQAGGYVISTGQVLNPDGTISDGSNIQNGNDGFDTNNNPIPPYSTDNSSSAQTDPSSDLYDGNGQFNIATMLNSLKSIINTLKELPQLFASVVTFMPSWLISLLALSIGMLVIIGVVKTITR